MTTASALTHRHNASVSVPDANAVPTKVEAGLPVRVQAEGVDKEAAGPVEIGDIPSELSHSRFEGRLRLGPVSGVPIWARSSLGATTSP